MRTSYLEAPLRLVGEAERRVPPGVPEHGVEDDDEADQLADVADEDDGHQQRVEDGDPLLVVHRLRRVVVVELLDVEALLFIAVELDGAMNLAEVFEIVEILLIFDLVDDNFSNVTNFVEE